jgi:MFS family permease|tara:strand:- start:1560 stop:2786 length:1227 start_codon:yes stop_codon:yes gene_type:complete
MRVVVTTPAPMSTLAMYRSLALSVYLPSFLMSLCQGSVVLMIPLFALYLGANPAIAAVVFAMRGLGNMISDVPAGYAASRIGDKTTMLTGVTLMAVVALLASQCTSPMQLAFAAFLFGGAMATWMLARLTHISESIHVSQRGKAIATMAGLQRFGNLIGPISSGIIADQFGFEYVFMCVSVIAALALMLVIFNVKENRSGGSPESPGMVALIPHILSNHRKVFATAGVSVLCLTILRSGRQLLVPLWGESLGLDATDIGLIVSCAAAVDMTMFIPVGLILDNLGRKYAAVPCMGILAVALFLIPLSDSFVTLLLAGMLAGLGNGFGSGINMTLGADFAPEHERGEFLGVWRLCSDLGSFAGPIIMGYIANSFLLATAFSFAGGLGVVGAFVMVVFVKETLVKAEADRG